tara:strand:+ start:1733 stop:2146 length:414 start_codon:yes stop_codon:yes gene_type:complete
MMKVYSKINPDLLLHVVNRLSDIKGRTEIIPEDNFLQCATIMLDKDKTFPAHYHIKKERSYDEQIAQESWIVVKGRVKCFMYDIDNATILATPILEQGDASFTLYGGHTYEILEEETIVYEYKTGPYEGQELDKRFI